MGIVYNCQDIIPISQMVDSLSKNQLTTSKRGNVNVLSLSDKSVVFSFEESNFSKLHQGGFVTHQQIGMN